MFVLSKVFAFVALSPLLFILLGLGGILVYKKRPRLAVGLLLGSLGLLYVLSITPTTYLLAGPLENRYTLNHRLIPRGDVYVVLGAGILERTSANTPFEKLPPAGLKRCLEAVYWYKRYPRPIIVCGGTPLRSGEAEATVMAALLQELGVPKKHIYTESFSRNTYENIRNARIFMQHHRWQRPLLITSALHMPRSMREAYRAGLHTVPLPCDFFLQTPAHFSWSEFLPSTYNLAENFSALKEYIGMVYYALRY